MESKSNPSRPGSPVQAEHDEASDGNSTTTSDAPPVLNATDIAALNERFRAIDSKLTLINNIFNLQSTTKAKKTTDSDDSSDGSVASSEFYDSDDSDNERLTRNVLHETIRVLGKLSNSHREFQRTNRRLRRARRSAKANADNIISSKEDEESSRAISTTAYLENKPSVLGWLEWPQFAVPWKRSLEESLQSPIHAVIGELDTKAFSKIRSPHLTEHVPSHPDRSTIAKDPAQETLPERIKIHSIAVHSVLTKFDGPNLPPLNPRDESIVLVRPFKHLVYYENELRDHLGVLEKHFSDLNSSGALSAESCEGKETLDSAERPESSEGHSIPGQVLRETEEPTNERLAHSVTALLHLRCLMTFFDEEIKPKLEYFAGDKCRKVLFHDLWHLYKPGNEVVDQAEKQAYRIIQVQSPVHNGVDLLARLANAQRTDQNRQEEKSRLSLKVHCAFIDFNGKGFGPVSITFSIPPFGGLKDIDSLPIYPLRLSKEVGLRDSLIARGKMLLNITTLKPMYYTGAALHTGEEIDSQVIVDFSEALADEQRKQWAPRIASVYTSSDVPDDCEMSCCAFANIAWDGHIDRNLATQSLDELVPSTPFRPPSLILSPRSLEEIIPGTEDEPSGDEFLLMTYRAFAFVLRTRKWAQLDLTYLRYENKDVRDSALSAFDRLELPKGHREMVRSLVTQHFRDKRAAGTRDDRTDLVRGKGKGLIMLLHGAPGVGKTTTAEGVAELFKKPLFHITCGDLGTTARNVEEELERNFALASRWGCILLLDEADVFLSARERKDFERNGLVAVFLRVLEYYTGILFLTTNRIGDFDEAFASRIHMSLFYPELDELKTKKVFKLNLDLIQERFDRQGRKITYDASSIEDFAQHHYREHIHSRWNGRQIRNACQTALALAEYDAHGGRVAQGDDDANDSSIVVFLQLRHFRLVQTAYLDFGRYLGDIRGTQGDRRAIDYGLRAKTHTPYQTNDPSYSSSTGNPAGLNVNRYRPNPLSSGHSSMYNYPSQGSQVADAYRTPVNQGELSGGGGAYAVHTPADVGPPIYRQHGASQGQLQGPSGMYNSQSNPQSHGYSYPGDQPGHMEPRQYQPPNQQVLGRSWGNPGPGSNQGYPPTSEPQQGQAQASSSQWQTTQAHQQQGLPLYRYSNAQHGGGSQIPTSGADFVLQSQASFGGQGVDPGVAGTSQGS